MKNNSFLLLTKTFLFSGFTTNKKDGNKSALRYLLIGAILTFIISFIYEIAILFILPNRTISLLNDFLVTVLIASSLMTLMMSITKMQGTLYQSGDYEFLSSLPLSDRMIIFAKFFSVYLFDLIEDLCICIPAFILYLLIAKNVYVAFIFFFSIFFISLIPLLVSSLLGTLLAFITSKFKHKNLATIIGYILLFLAIFIISFFVSFNTTTIALDGDLNNISLDYSNYLPYFKLIKWAFEPTKIYFFFLFILINIIALVLTLSFISLIYKKINDKLNKNKIDNIDYKKGISKSSDYSKTLYKKEVAMLFHKPYYLINSLIGPFMAGLMSWFFIFTFNTGVQDDDVLNSIMVLILILVMQILMNAISSLTTTSVSLEKENLEMLFAMPITKKEIIDAKLKLGIISSSIINLVFGISLSIGYSIMFGFDIGAILFLLVIPIMVSTLTAYIGMFTGLRWAKLHFENDMQLFRNSACINFMVLFDMLPNIILLILDAFIILFIYAFNLPTFVSFLIVFVIYLIPLLILRHQLNKHGTNLLNKALFR